MVQSEPHGQFQIDVVHDEDGYGYVWRIYHSKLAPSGACSVSGAAYGGVTDDCWCDYCNGLETHPPLLKGNGDTESHAAAVAEEHLDEAAAIIRRRKLAGVAW